jgi:hypothetical protein
MMIRYSALEHVWEFPNLSVVYSPVPVIHISELLLSAFKSVLSIALYVYYNYNHVIQVCIWWIVPTIPVLPLFIQCDRLRASHSADAAEASDSRVSSV